MIFNFVPLIPLLAIVSASVGFWKFALQRSWISFTQWYHIRCTLVYVYTVAQSGPMFLVFVPFLCFRLWLWDPLFERMVPKLYSFINAAVYQPIDSRGREIRTLLLSPGQDDQPIHCALDEHGVEDLAFEALSYTWGKHQALRRRIYVDGRPFLVTNSVQRALNSLRHPTNYRRLWIDQICINQADLEERAQQVQYCMREVYSHAQGVIVWLGSPQQHFLFRYTEKLYDVGVQAVGWVFAFRRRSTLLTSIPFTDLLAFGYAVRDEPVPLESSPALDLLDYKAVLRRHWWKRVWVIQEIGLARRAVLRIGTTEIEWNLFCSQLSQNFQVDPLQSRLLAFRTGTGDNLLSGASLLDLVQIFKGFESSDPRDKLFALYALAEPDALLVPVSYKRPAQEIFADFTAQIITNSGSLQILSMSATTSSWRTGCTWLVPWDDMSVMHKNQRHFWGMNALKSESLVLPQYDACGGLKAQVHRHATSPCWLSFKVFFAGQVRSLGVPCLGDEPEEEIGAYLRQWIDHAGFDDDTDEGDSRFLMFCNTITAGMTANTLTYIDVGKVIWPGRRFFITRDGSYGLGPADTRIGDLVCLIPGADVPVVLRKTTSCWWDTWRYWDLSIEIPCTAYQFVGFCYVPEMTYNSEFCSKTNAGEIELEDIYLI